jgi:hypothetical protein
MASDFSGDCSVPASLDRFLAHGLSDIIEPMLKELAEVTVTEIQKPGVCPVQSGDLRDHHAVSRETDNAYDITNSMWYWPLVVFGGPNNVPNNYPSRAVSSALSMGAVAVINSNLSNLFR